MPRQALKIRSAGGGGGGGVGLWHIFFPITMFATWTLWVGVPSAYKTDLRGEEQIGSATVKCLKRKVARWYCVKACDAIISNCTFMARKIIIIIFFFFFFSPIKKFATWTLWVGVPSAYKTDLRGEEQIGSATVKCLKRKVVRWYCVKACDAIISNCTFMARCITLYISVLIFASCDITRGRRWSGGF